jgi:hypothetical protein
MIIIGKPVPKFAAEYGIQLEGRHISFLNTDLACSISQCIGNVQDIFIESLRETNWRRIVIGRARHYMLIVEEVDNDLDDKLYGIYSE